LKHPLTFAMNLQMDTFTLVLLVAAAVVFWLLRSVLGRRTGFEKPAPDFTRPAELPARKTAPLEAESTPATTPVHEPVWKGHVAEDTPAAKGLEAIAKASRSFDVQTFLGGAKAAYELILDAFAKGDKQALKPLLSRDVFAGFADAIDQRVNRGESVQFQFVGVKSATIISASLEVNRAAIGVKFVSEVISATRDNTGKIIDGHEKAVRELTDEWVFEKDVRSRDPNWKLVSTDGNDT
jgi:predicted lipid-binding transport protein (Tim44 family)